MISREDGNYTIEEQHPMTTAFSKYRRTAIAEMRPWMPDVDMSRVSISAPDKEAGSPKTGDMVARNPKNYNDQWLVAAQYFADNFEPIAAAPPPDAGEADDLGMHIAAWESARIQQALVARAQSAEATVERLTGDLSISQASLEMAVAAAGRFQADAEKAEAALADAREALSECADDLQREIEDRYASTLDHPAIRPKYERDMATVARARAALASSGDGPAEVMPCKGCDGSGWVPYSHSDGLHGCPFCNRDERKLSPSMIARLPKEPSNG